MKCLVLAGGKGERLWPLSRRNCPKQFISVQGNHSVFQETVARNIPFCDEFIIVTSEEYKYIVTNQMKAFQGITYRIILEGAPRRTLAPICLACLDLVQSEYVFVVSSDLLISPTDEYKEAILKAKRYAEEGFISTFAREEDRFDPRYGYLSDLAADGTCSRFVEKPEEQPSGRLFRNLGMALFTAGDLINEVGKLIPDYLGQIRKAYSEKQTDGSFILYPGSAMEDIPALSLERALLASTSLLRGVDCHFVWNELTGFKDLKYTSYKNEGTVCLSNSEGTIAINNSSDQALVVDGIEDAVVVATEDAVYVGRKDSDLKKVLGDCSRLEPFLAKGVYSYRQWGYFETLVSGNGFYIRRVVVSPGRTIYAHRHDSREENWTLLEGKAVVTLDDKVINVTSRMNFNIPAGTMHQISNTGDRDVIFIDTTFGEALNNEEQLPRQSDDVREMDLGIESEPLVRMSPVFKDYLWGGRTLVDRFGFTCDYDHVAEAWVAGAHRSGQSVIASGRHSGKTLGSYIDTVGKQILGWKCSHLAAFPILVKLIDAKEDLSVQVHPDDDYAMENEGEYGKNEMWYVIDTREGAGLYVGFREDVTKEQVRRATEDGTLTDLLNFVPTKPGDVFFIPAGTVHAIGKGNLICEVQQSSDCTYRLYDFGRRDKYGNLRELHIDKALDVADFHKYEPQDLGSFEDLICRCKYFEVYKYDVDGNADLTLPFDDSVFRCLVCLEGSGEVVSGTTSIDLSAGDSVFISSLAEDVRLSGNMSVMVCHV